MGLNTSKGNMYSFITNTFNTIKGICPHGCTYCYMHRFPQKEVRFDESELKTDLGEGNFIFVGSSCDMFAEEIPEKWILDTLSHCESFTKNKYLFQSKNPNRMLNCEGYFPYSVFCTTIETNRVYPQMGNTPMPLNRAAAMGEISMLGGTCYVTLEPLMDFDLKEIIELIRMCNPKQVNIGADSGQVIDGKLQFILPEPPKEKILALVEELKKFTTIDQKRNLARLLK